MTQKRRAPASTPEAREAQMVAYATNLAEKQLIEGTASAMVITHYLKLGTAKEKAELEKVKAETELKKKQIESIDDAKELEKSYLAAIEAIRRYSPSGGGDE